MKSNKTHPDQVYNNKFDLELVPHVLDPGGQPRPPLNLYLHYFLEQGTVPPGFMLWEPAWYPEEKWLRYAPEYCYVLHRYQLNELLGYLHDLGVQGIQKLAPLVYATDYGCIQNTVRQYVERKRDSLFNGNPVSDYAKEKAVQEIFDFIADTCGYHYSWPLDVITAANENKAAEDACMTIAQWETRENPKNLTYIVRGTDRQDKPREPLKRIVQCLDANKMPPGFTPNTLFVVSQEMKWWLRWIPEYALTDGYNLRQLVEWLDGLHLSVEDKMSIIYATNWGYTQHFLYKRTEEAALAGWVKTPRPYLMAGFTKMMHKDIVVCGSQATQYFRKDFYRNRKAG